MALAGIEVKVYHPKWRCFYKIRKRMHDKILLIEELALLGSSSFWDVSFDRWQVETDVLLKGPETSKVKNHFEEIWNSKEVYSVQKKDQATFRFFALFVFLFRLNASLKKCVLDLCFLIVC